MSAVAAALAALAMPAALTPSALGARIAPQDARARLVSCVRALHQADRSLTAEGAMRAVAGTRRMQMRFDLYRRVGTRVRHVAGPGLGAWSSSSAGVLRYRFRKRIENLPAPGVWFVRVSHRWLDGGGDVIARAQRRTAACLQPDPRPDLHVFSYAVEPLGSGRWLYLISVRNGGRSPAGDFDVTLTLDGVARPAVPVEGLATGANRLVAIEAPRCRVTAAVALDPDNRVAEASERNNRHQAPCGP